MYVPPVGGSAESHKYNWATYALRTLISKTIMNCVHTKPFGSLKSLNWAVWWYIGADRLAWKQTGTDRLAWRQTRAISWCGGRLEWIS